MSMSGQSPQRSNNRLSVRRIAAFAIAGAVGGTATGGISAFLELLLPGQGVNSPLPWLFEYCTNGLVIGLFIGCLLAVLSLQWGALGRPLACAFICAIVLGACGLAVGTLVGNDAGTSKALRLLWMGTIIGAVFGVTQGVIVRWLRFRILSETVA